MSLILATGSNIGDKEANLILAKKELSKIFNFTAESQIYSSPAIEYTNQADFFNQVLEFKIPKIPPQEAMLKILNLEEKLGRTRLIAKGPRIIDIDIIFWGFQHIQSQDLIIPHPAWHQRSFVVLPLKELPFSQKLLTKFSFPDYFNNHATPIKGSYAG